MRRRLLTLLGFATGIFAGTVIFRRTIAKPRDRVDIYFDDGSMVSFGDGSEEAAKLLPIARDALAAARQ
jgi:hypothetical protein